MPEERKFVTILFVDVVGSTQLSGTLDPEQLREKIGRFFSIAREEVERLGGTVEKFIGDAVMAIFGLPAIHENDPERAMQAAVSIRSRARPYIEAGIIPQIRIGVNTGEVVANPQAAEQGEFMITGEVVNLAARLQQQAQPGQILVGVSTQASTGWAFEYRKVPPLQVKGKPDKVIAYECLGPRARPAPSRGVHPVGSALVGRQKEFRALIGCVERLRTGQGGIVALIGEAGLGKSRLIAEIRRQVSEEDMRWVEGRALPYRQTISYWPFLEIIKNAAGITENDRGAESWAKLEHRVSTLLPHQVAEIVPYLGVLLGLEAIEKWQERIKYLDGEAMRRQVYRTSRLFFEHLARERPLILVFEDLHWLDQSSSGLLEHLLPLVKAVPLLLCGLARPDPETPATRIREIALQHYAGLYTEVRLSLLRPNESAQLVQNLLAIDHSAGRLQDVIFQKTEGNPFFVEEIVRVLIEMGAVAQDEVGRWTVNAPVEQIAIPDTLRGVIMARVDRLDNEVKQVLKTAAVIGRSFFYRVLQAIAETQDTLDRDLAELQLLELIREKKRVPELEYIFKHALIQEATYESILVRRRRELHRRVGEAIESLFSDRLEEFYGLLAYHFARAEEWTKAQNYLFKAGDQAGKVAADAEALAHYRQASAAFARVYDRWDPMQRASLERKMGEALFRGGDHHQASEFLERALAYLGSPFPTSRWAVVVAIGGQLVRQIGHRCLPGLILRQADGSQPAIEERMRVYVVMGWIDYSVGGARLILEALTALNISERHPYPLGIARGSTGVGLICDLIPAYGIAGTYHRRAVAIAEQMQHPVALGLAHIGTGMHELHAGHSWDSALEHFGRSAAAYREAGELNAWGAAATLMAWVLRLRGDFARSMELDREIIRVGEGAGDPQLRGWGLAELGHAHCQLGQLNVAVANLQEAIELFQRASDYRWIVITNSGLGSCYLRQGKLHEALALLEDTSRLIAQRGFRSWLGVAPGHPLAEAYLLSALQAGPKERTGWLGKAKEACRVAVNQSKIDALAGLSAYRVQGTYAWLTEQRAAAQAWWQRSLSVAQKFGARYDLALTHLEMGTWMDDALSLERARRIFDEIGADVHADTAPRTA